MLTIYHIRKMKSNKSCAHFFIFSRFSSPPPFRRRSCEPHRGEVSEQKRVPVLLSFRPTRGRMPACRSIPTKRRTSPKGAKLAERGIPSPSIACGEIPPLHYVPLPSPSSPPSAESSRRRKEQRRQRSRFLPTMAKTSVRRARTPHRGDAYHARLDRKSVV